MIAWSFLLAACPCRAVDRGNIGERHLRENATVPFRENATSSAPTVATKEGNWRDGFPPEAFTSEENRKGAIVCWVALTLYTFLAISIICDEFFVPALEVLSERMNLPNDVAGATLMAMGGSAPEFFTSITGTIIAKTDVGIGTIVGSAVFNVLFVIGACAVASPVPLELTWWPLFRDSAFYTFGLILLSVFFLNGDGDDSSSGRIEVYEAACLFATYVAYCLFMWKNETIEDFVTAMFFGESSSRVMPMHAVPALVSDSSGKSAQPNQLGVTVQIDSILDIRTDEKTVEPTIEAELEEEGGPMEISLPFGQGAPAWIWFLLSLPICVVLVFTVPDVRRAGREHLYLPSFVISICWVAVATYFMVWGASVTADAIGMSVNIMGLTVLSIGTSVPDFITSVIVAKQGKGDMAVSSSIGSNIFDITVGLPIPWLLFQSLNNGEPVPVDRKGLGPSVICLLLMLICTVIVIKLNRWVMTKKMGMAMWCLYIVFMAQGVVTQVIADNSA